jgi:hypothetical protein
MNGIMLALSLQLNSRGNILNFCSAVYLERKREKCFIFFE